MLYQIKVYETSKGFVPLEKWLYDELDETTRQRIILGIRKLELGNFSNSKKLTSNIDELKFDFGAGYRLYYAKIGKAILLLLAGGSKKTQKKDIERAQEFYNDYEKGVKKHGIKKL